MNAASDAITAPPSRDANPFATCWTRPGALPWCGDIDAIVKRLHNNAWRGQVVGPHGSGKTTLLRALVEPLREAGQRPTLFDATTDANFDVGALLLVEAFERLPRREQWRRIAVWRHTGVGFVVTTHRQLRSWFSPLAPIVETQPTEAIVTALFAKLTEHRSTSVTFADALASFARRDGDLRETWFDLYSLHENRTRTGRTVWPAVAYSQRQPALQDAARLIV